MCIRDDDVLQSMNQALQLQLQKDEKLKETHYIAASRFLAVLQAYRKRPEKRSKSLQEVGDKLRVCPNLKLWFPVLSDKHAVAFCVDFGERTIAYGNSLTTAQPPNNIVILIQYWLQRSHGGRFKNTGNSLTHGEQKDLYSCIPITMSTIAHEVFGKPIRTHGNRFLDRIQWFQTLFPETGSSPASQTMDSSTTQTVLKPNLTNLLNSIEETAWGDVMDEFCDADVPPAFDCADSVSIGSHPEISFPNYEPTSSENGTPIHQELSVMDVDDALSMLQTTSTFKGMRNGWDFLKPDTGEGVKLKKRVSASGEGSRLSKKQKGEPKAPKPQGQSKAAKSQRKAVEAAKQGEFDPKKRESWKEEIRSIDPKAQFFDDDLLGIRCSNCGGRKRASKPTDTSNFKSHWQRCTTKRYDLKPAKPATARTMPVASKFWKEKWNIFSHSSRPTLPNGKPKPPSGGGSPSITKLALELFTLPYRKLTRSQKSEVAIAQTHNFTWKNDHPNLCVFSTQCTHISPGIDSAQIDIPEDENYKYVNTQWRVEKLGEQFVKTHGLKPMLDATESGEGSVWVNFARGVLDGKYKDRKVFLGLVKSMVTKIDRDERGVGMQNFCHAPGWDELVQILHSHSPRVHRLLSKHFPVRIDRNIRLKQSRAPKIPLEICDTTFTRVEKYLNDIGYHGPVAIACDDTKLFSTLGLYWDEEQKGYLLVGGTKGPMRVLNSEKVSEYMTDPNIIKGTKLHLWLLQIPLPKIPPIVIATIPITDNPDVPALLALHKSIVFGLLNHHVKILTYSCDGTETERKVQHDFDQLAEEWFDYTIGSPSEGLPDLKLRIATFSGRPIINVQDSKHSSKTERNNIFTGAHLLVLGNYTAHFQIIHDLAFDPDSPLYHRDVEKLDRQDDNAAARLFSAPTVQFLAGMLDDHPEYLGVVVYLFVFGECTDAYQNRHISHEERLNMLLRTISWICGRYSLTPVQSTRPHRT
ncbi:hypothetical protein VKT23_007811 [Stygiomarasmius scandens]|uniref:Transposase n=1 Tax=Marasmiellus scandens TaxID=2682957 RepID=A0ABR1JJE1_9AGAR